VRALLRLDSSLDPRNGVHHVVTMEQANDMPHRIDPNQVLDMRNADGKAFRCLLPSGQRETDADNAEVQPASDPLEKLRGTCIPWRREGWWTYEVCVDKHVRQYHLVRSLVAHHIPDPCQCSQQLLRSDPT
jgi:hypothetical protein